MFEKTDSFKLISILFINLSFLLFIYQVKKYLLKWTFSVNLLFKACVFFNLKLNFKLKVVNKISVEFKRIYWEKMTSTVTLVFRRDTIIYDLWVFRDRFKNVILIKIYMTWLEGLKNSGSKGAIWGQSSNVIRKICFQWTSFFPCL